MGTRTYRTKQSTHRHQNAQRLQEGRPYGGDLKFVQRDSRLHRRLYRGIVLRVLHLLCAVLGAGRFCAVAFHHNQAGRVSWNGASNLWTERMHLTCVFGQ